MTETSDQQTKYKFKRSDVLLLALFLFLLLPHLQLLDGPADPSLARKVMLEGLPGMIDTGGMVLMVLGTLGLGVALLRRWISEDQVFRKKRLLEATWFLVFVGLVQDHR